MINWWRGRLHTGKSLNSNFNRSLIDKLSSPILTCSNTPRYTIVQCWSYIDIWVVQVLLRTVNYATVPVLFEIHRRSKCFFSHKPSFQRLPYTTYVWMPHIFKISKFVTLFENAEDEEVRCTLQKYMMQSKNQNRYYPNPIEFI